MLRCNTKTLFKMRGVIDPFHWLTRRGFPISAARAFAKDNYKQIPLVHFEKLCMLLHCTPNDLLSWEPPEGTDVSSQPMRNMMDEGTVGLEWLEKLGSMSLQELRALGKKIEGDL